jgi:hypothetical protein
MVNDRVFLWVIFGLTALGVLGIVVGTIGKIFF